MAENKFLFEITSPEGIVFSEEVLEVTLPTQDGEITILPHHAPLLTKLAEGEIIIHKPSGKASVVITGGFLEINKNKAHALSDYAIRAESIEIAHSEERKKQAEKRLEELAGKKEFAIAEKEFKKSILELKVAQRIKKRHQG